ncbi:AlpA family phage regulatory protein [Pectobacterium cacticida]|uniref:AlpA family phage regulatory protein n=1 Tax=Pectobacterium cacticida TaxID=69221 RepID=UPI003987242D
MKSAIRKARLLEIVLLPESKIKTFEKTGKFPKRFQISTRAVAWNGDSGCHEPLVRRTDL